MSNNLNINGTTYQNVAKMRVKIAGTSNYVDLVDSSDATANTTDIVSGKTAYVNGYKVMGSYTAPSTVSPDTTGTVIVSNRNQFYANNVITFFDQYGLILYTYDTTDSSVFPLSELPSPPTETNYTITWNKTLAEVNDMTTGGVVSCNVVAGSLAPTVIYPSAKGFSGSISLYFQRKSSSITLTIDWGDGSTNTTKSPADYADYTSHSFSSASTNPIKITPSSSSGYYLGGMQGSSYPYRGYSFMYGHYSYFAQLSSYAPNSQIVNTIKLGDGAELYYNSLNSFCSLEKILIPNGATELKAGCLGSCVSLKSISLPSTMTSIGNVAFGNGFVFGETNYNNNSSDVCLSLKTVVIPNSVTSIGEHAFSKCAALINVALPSSLTTLSNYAFYNCYSLTTIKIPDTLTSIGSSVFYYNYSLTNLDLGNGLTDIGAGAFDYCYSLIKVILPSTLTTIGNQCFRYASYENVTIPASVTSIGSSAFYTRTLKFVTCTAETPPTMSSGAFYPLSGNVANPGCLFYVPGDSLLSYKSATNWSSYANNMLAL